MADDALAAQTERLQIVNRFGWELAQHTRLTALATALSRLFGEAFPGLGVCVWVARERSAQVDPLCEAGPVLGAPVREYPLFSGAEFVGKLDVFGPGDAPELALVQDLLPWVSIALGNARSFALLAEYRDQLSHKVSLRTAELNAAMQKLEESLRREREASRRKTEFFDNISHELRTPLTLILLTIETLQLGGDTEISTAEHLARMEQSATRLLRLIDDLLELAKAEAGQVRLRWQEVDVPALLERVLLPFRVAAEKKRISLRLECDSVEKVYADAEKLEGVFQNLVSNALKFTDHGEVVIRARQDAQAVHVEVTDTGVGISHGDLGRVFERFAQANEDGDGPRRPAGTGIGLSLVKELVELHGGTVGVESQLSAGSTFRVTLPRGAALDEANRTGEAARAAVEPAAPLSGRRRPVILVAEDDGAVREMLRRLLAPRYELLEAADGREALEAALRAKPALILSDVMMPVMSGLELLAALRSLPETQDLPVIMLTARHDLDERVQGLTAGANDYVSKPFSPRELLARIDTQLRLRDAASRIAQTERIAATSLVTAGFAHEVRNPLNGLINALGPLRESLGERPDPALATEMLDIVEESAGRVRHLADSLLALVRSSPAHTDFDVRDTLAAAERALRWKVPPTVKLERHLEQVPKLSGDPAALTQVWVNLLDNALRAAGPEGALRISVASEEGHVVVRVEDDGPGIAPEQQARLFEPFFSTRPPGEGTGLGLAMCRRIVTAHRGTIDLQSGRGAGTSVLVRLPFEMPADRTPPEVKSSRDTARGERAGLAELTSGRASLNETV